MGEIQKLYVSLALKASEFTGGLEEARGKAESFASSVRGRVGGALSAVAGIGRAAFLGVGTAAVAGFGLAMRSAIDMNSQLETSTLQFQTLMGDADKAQEHVKALFEFAGATPFETQPIIDASLKLETFGGAALNTMDNLTLVGDAAAAVGQPIDEVAFWVGRAYAAMQAGQPFGEAAMRLQEMGIMGPEARQALEDLQASGASGSEVFALFREQLGGFSGAMELQAGTWQGLTSTIKDNLNLLVAGALAPFFELIKTGLAGVAQWLSSPEVQTAIQTFAANLTMVIGVIAQFVQEHVIPFVQSHGPELKAVLMALAIAFGGLLVIGAVVTLVGMLTNPIVLIAGLIGVLAAAWINNWGGIQDKTNAVVTFIQNLIQAFVTAVRGWWDEHGEAILATTTKVWNLIKGVIDGVVTQIKLIVQLFKAAFQGDWERFGEIIIELWINAWETVVNFLSGLWAMVGPFLAQLWTNIKGWFTETDWRSLGKAIIDGIIAGINQFVNNLWDAVTGIASGALAKIKEALGIQSPAAALVPVGEAIVAGIVAGIDSSKTLLERAMDGLGKVAGLAGGFASIFEDRTIKPLQDRISGLKKNIDQYTGSLADMAASLGMKGFDPNSGQSLLWLQQMLAGNTLTADQRSTATVMLGFLKERWKLTSDLLNAEAELVKQQEKMAELERLRGQYGFLQQQWELLKMVRDNGLDPSVLNGLQLGVNADPNALMQAMVGAMGQLIGVTSNELSAAAGGTGGQYGLAGGASTVINGGLNVTVNEGGTLALADLAMLGR